MRIYDPKMIFLDPLPFIKNPQKNIENLAGFGKKGGKGSDDGVDGMPFYRDRSNVTVIDVLFNRGNTRELRHLRVMSSIQY